MSPCRPVSSRCARSSADGAPVVTVRLAWRNLRRNRRRTAITCAALALNTAVLVVSYALRTGLIADMQREATRLTTGDAQAHAADYLRGRSIHDAIADPQELIAAARARGILAAPRSFAQGLVFRGARSVGVRIWGVDPAAERAAFELAGRVSEGSFLDGDPARGIVLGRGVARALQAGVGDEIALVAPAADGSLGNDLFRVAGILGPAGDELDRRAALVHAADFSGLLATAGRVHEIALNGQGRLAPAAVAAVAAADRPDIVVQTWRELLPHLASLLELWEATIWIFGVIFALAAAVGVANIMLMTTRERRREFGIQKALGATPWRIVRDVTAEALLLSGAATLAGAAAGWAVAARLHHTGLDVGRHLAGSVSFSGIVFDPVLRPALTVRAVALPVALLVAASLLATLYPAIKAARTEPSRTIAGT